MDICGIMPLHLAINISNLSIVTMLLEAGADPLSREKINVSPLRISFSKLLIFFHSEPEEMNPLIDEICFVHQKVKDHLLKQGKLMNKLITYEIPAISVETPLIKSISELKLLRADLRKFFKVFHPCL